MTLYHSLFQHATTIHGKIIPRQYAMSSYNSPGSRQCIMALTGPLIPYQLPMAFQDPSNEYYITRRHHPASPFQYITTLHDIWTPCW